MITEVDDTIMMILVFIIMMVIIIMMVRLEQVFSFRTCPSSRHKGKASHQKSSLPTCPRFKNKTCPRVSKNYIF